MANIIDRMLTPDPTQLALGQSPVYMVDQGGDDENTFQNILEAVLKGKWWILGIFATVAVITFFYTRSLPDEFRSSTMLFVNKSAPQVETGGIVTFGIQNRDIANELVMMSSRTLADRVAERLLESGDPNDLPILKDDEGNLLDVNQLSARIRGKINANQYQGTDHIKIDVVSTSATESKVIADLFSNEYVLWRLETSRGSLDRAMEFLQEQEQSVKDTLENSRQALGDFLESNEAVGLDAQTTTVVSNIAQIEASRDAANLDLEVARSALRGIENQISDIEPGIENRISSTDEAVITALKIKISQREAELQERYAVNPGIEGNESSDPEAKKTLDEINRLKTQVRQKTNAFIEQYGDALIGTQASVGNGIRSDFEYLGQLRQQRLEQELNVGRLEARVRVFNQQLGKLNAQKSTIPDRSIELAELTRVNQSNEQFHQHITDRLQEVQLATQSEVGDIEIVETALKGNLSGPNRTRNLLMGCLLGLMLGIGFIFVRTMTDNKIHKPEDLQRKGYNVLGIVPDMADTLKKDFNSKPHITYGDNTIATTLVTLLAPLSPTSEAYRELRTNIEFSKIDTDLRTILVSSAAPGEGKTVTAINLAIALAQSGKKVAYVDCDLRRPNGHKMIQMPKEPGLSDVLLGNKLRDFSTPIEGLFVVPAGSKVPNPAEFLGSAKMKAFIQEMEKEFDIVVLDTPPALAATDAMLLSRNADMILLVVSAGETEWGGLKRSVEKFKGVGVLVGGLILNRFNPKAAYGYYSYYKGYGYYNYYEDDEKNSDGRRSKKRKK